MDGSGSYRFDFSPNVYSFCSCNMTHVRNESVAELELLAFMARPKRSGLVLKRSEGLYPLQCYVGRIPAGQL